MELKTVIIYFACLVVTIGISVYSARKVYTSNNIYDSPTYTIEKKYEPVEIVVRLQIPTKHAGNISKEELINVFTEKCGAEVMKYINIEPRIHSHDEFNAVYEERFKIIILD